ncbi:MAG: hypothetical protein KC426_09155, partial [Oceanospirillaceae bacterium]|nr:hypothetical protein [Oceanospirillaceae bacterium]
MNIIEDFRERILDNVNDLLVESLIYEWKICNQTIEIHKMRKFLIEHDPNHEDPPITPDEEALLRKTKSNMETKITLVTHPDMKKAWDNLNNRLNDDSTSENILFWESRECLMNIMLALSGGNYWEKLSPTRRKNEHTDLVDSLKNIAIKLNEIGYEDPVVGFGVEHRHNNLTIKLQNTSMEIPHEK